MARQQTPDIMDTLMNGQSQPKEIEPYSNKEIKQSNLENNEGNGEGFSNVKQEKNKAIKLSKNKAIKQDNDMEIIELKEKATFNLSRDTLLKLEDAWIQLKRQLKGEQRVTKTAIVEIALEICITELAQKETESTLYKWLAES